MASISLPAGIANPDLVWCVTRLVKMGDTEFCLSLQAFSEGEPDRSHWNLHADEFQKFCEDEGINHNEVLTLILAGPDI